MKTFSVRSGIVATFILILAGCGSGDTVTGSGAPATPGTVSHAGNRQTPVAATVAASNYNTVVQQLYISYFGRPADPAGLANFTAALAAAGAPTDIQGLNAAYAGNASIKTLVDAFGTSAESNALYTGGTASFVNAIYSNVLNRPADSAGLQFWSDAIDRGILSKGNAALSIMAGALVNNSSQGLIDAAVVNNKVQVGANFTSSASSAVQTLAYSGDSAAASARAMLATVTNTTNVTAFQSTIDSTLAALVTSVSSIPKPSPSAGSSSTYTVIFPAGSAIPTLSYTRTYSQVNSDGTKTRVDTYGVGGAPAYTYSLDSDLGVTNYTTTAGTACSYSPRSIGPIYPTPVGQTWDNSYTSTCVASGVTTVTQIRNTGSTTLVESVTTPAGTFAAGKRVGTTTSTVAGVSTTVETDTCWLDLVTARLLKCDTATTITPVNGTPSNLSSTYSLIGYVDANGNGLPTVARFAGAWSGTIGGGDTGVCSSVTVSDTGSVSGSCISAGSGTFTIGGAVSASGAATITTSIGTTFVGNFTSPSAAGGVWSKTTATGTWTMSHQ